MACSSPEPAGKIPAHSSAPFTPSLNTSQLFTRKSPQSQIYEDPNDLADWDLAASSRCFIHLCDALVWREITGTNPPQTPVTAREYERAGLPWFDFYRDDVAVLEGSKTLAGVKSVVQISKEKGDMAVVGNDSVESEELVHCGPKKRTQEVREWGGP